MSERGYLHYKPANLHPAEVSRINSAQAAKNTELARFQPGVVTNPNGLSTKPRPGRVKGQRTASKSFLKRIRHTEEWVDIFRLAKKAKKYAICVEILKFHHEQAFGKAFVASDPALSERVNNLTGDRVLQSAIAELLPGATVEMKSATIQLNDANRDKPSTINDLQVDSGETAEERQPETGAAGVP